MGPSIMNDTTPARTIASLAEDSPASRASARPAGRIDRWILARMRQRLFGIPLRVTLWDGATLGLSDEPEAAEVIVRDRRTLLALVRNPPLAFGDAYAGGRISVRGDLVRLLEAIYRHWEGTPAGRRPEKRRWRPNGLRRARENIHYHYDIGNDFYRLWLDDQLVYTCAYFPTPGAGLEEAQTAKLEHVCRKLRLRPGETVVEAGCGWGALALHMAPPHGRTGKAHHLPAEQVGVELAAEDPIADRPAVFRLQRPPADDARPEASDGLQDVRAAIVGEVQAERLHHSRSDPARAHLVAGERRAIEHHHVEAGLAQAPGDGRAGGAAAHDDGIGGGHASGTARPASTASRPRRGRR